MTSERDKSYTPFGKVDYTEIANNFHKMNSDTSIIDTTITPSFYTDELIVFNQNQGRTEAYTRPTSAMRSVTRSTSARRPASASPSAVARGTAGGGKKTKKAPK